MHRPQRRVNPGKVGYPATPTGATANAPPRGQTPTSGAGAQQREASWATRHRRRRGEADDQDDQVLVGVSQHPDHRVAAGAAALDRFVFGSQVIKLWLVGGLSLMTALNFTVLRQAQREVLGGRGS